MPPSYSAQATEFKSGRTIPCVTDRQPHPLHLPFRFLASRIWSSGCSITPAPILRSCHQRSRPGRGRILSSWRMLFRGLRWLRRHGLAGSPKPVREQNLQMNRCWATLFRKFRAACRSCTSHYSSAVVRGKTACDCDELMNPHSSSGHCAKFSRARSGQETALPRGWPVCRIATLGNRAPLRARSGSRCRQLFYRRS